MFFDVLEKSDRPLHNKGKTAMGKERLGHFDVITKITSHAIDNLLKTFIILCVGTTVLSGCTSAESPPNKIKTILDPNLLCLSIWQKIECVCVFLFCYVCDILRCMCDLL